MIVCGPPGAGKTVLVRQALGTADVIRIECVPGVSAGEVLGELGHALLGRGDERLHQVLSRESPFGVQLEAAKETLARTDAGLWIEDVDYLGQGPLGRFDSQRRESRDLLASCAVAVRLGLRLLVTVEDDAVLNDTLFLDENAAGHFRIITLPGLDTPDVKRLWSVVSARGENPPLHLTRPLEIRLAARLRNAGTAADGDLRRLFLLVWDSLSAPAKHLMAYCVHADGRLTLGLVRHLERRDACDDGAFEEVSRWELLESAGETTNRLQLNPALAPFVREMAAETDRELAHMREVLGDYWKETGHRARRFWDLLRAAELYTQAACTAAAHELQREVVEQLLRRDYLDLGEEILGRTVEQAGGRTRAVALGNLAIVRKNKGDHDSALNLYEQACRQFEELGDQANVARVLHQLGNTHYLKGDMDTAVRHYEQSRQVAHACGDDSVAAAAQVQTANVHFLRGDFEEAARRYAESLDTAQRLGDRRMALAVLLQLGQIHYAQEAFLEADEALARADGLAEEVGDSVSVAKALQFRGLVARSRRDLEEAERHFSRAQKLGEALRNPGLVATALYHRSYTKMEQGDLITALRHVAAAAALFAENDMGEVKAAWALIREIASRVGEEQFVQLANQANVAWILDDPAD